MSRRSLAFRLLCLSAAAATLPALVIAVILQTISSRSLQNSIQQTQMETALRLAEDVRGEIRNAQSILMYAARSAPVLSGNVPDTQRALMGVLRSLPSVQEVMVVQDTGEERVKVTRQGTSGRLIKRTINLKESSIGAPFFSGNRLPTVLITEPVQSAAGRRGLVAKMSFTTLGTLMQQTRVGQRGIAFIVDQHGALLAHADQARVRAHTSVAKTPVVREWMLQPDQPTGLHEYIDDQGVRVMALAVPIPLLQSAVVVQQPKADVYAPLKQMRYKLIVWTVLWVGFFLALTVLITWRIQQPLRQLQVAAEQIAEGKMDIQLNIHTDDELEELGKAFSRMTKSLRHMEAMRRDLINMLVHDLKSPLSSMLASMDYLLTGHVGFLNAEQKKFLTIGHRSGTDLLRLVQNLLDVAKMEDGKLPLNKEFFSPQVWVDEAVNTFQPVAEAGKKKLSVVMTEDLPPIEGDASLLNRVLANLLSNALRHTPMETGEVVVTLSQRDNHLVAEVRDNGQGIPPEYQTRIFEKFVQVERKRAHVRTGTGLGLTFCKMVVEAHGGRIFVQSVPGEGSTFTFLLPIVPAPPAAPPVSEPAVPRILTGSSN